MNELKLKWKTGFASSTNERTLSEAKLTPKIRLRCSTAFSSGFCVSMFVNDVTIYEKVHHKLNLKQAQQYAEQYGFKYCFDVLTSLDESYTDVCHFVDALRRIDGVSPTIIFKINKDFSLSIRRTPSNKIAWKFFTAFETKAPKMTEFLEFYIERGVDFYPVSLLEKIEKIFTVPGM